MILSLYAISLLLAMFFIVITVAFIILYKIEK